MNSTQKPIKRGKELVQLSRDHHGGLLLCWKIRTGLKKEIEEKRIADYVVYFFEVGLKEHFRQEEELIFCLVPASDSMRQRAVKEHEEIYRMIQNISANQPPDKDVLHRFADYLENHIRFEERGLFPYIEQNAVTEKLRDAGKIIDQLHEGKEKEPAWQDEFWAYKK